MDGEKAFSVAREASYNVAERVLLEMCNDRLPAERYNGILKEELADSFPSINWERAGGGRNMEHVVHWVLTGAGMDIIYEGRWDRLQGFVCQNGYSSERVESMLDKYKPHIMELGKYL